MSKHTYTLIVKLDGLTTFNNLVDGGYSLRAGKLHTGPGFHDSTQVPLHQSLQDLKIVDSLSEKLSLTLNFEADPPSNPSYWIGFQPIIGGAAGTIDPAQIKPVTLGQIYRLTGNAGSVPANEPWVPADAFGFQNDAVVKPLLWRSDDPTFTPDPSAPWKTLKTWVPGSGIIRPAVLRNNLEAWFEQADPLDPTDENSIETADQSIESQRIKWSLAANSTTSWTGTLNYTATGFTP